MKPLDPLTAPGAILSFDFDGTVHDPASQPAVPLRFFATLERLRDSHRACWGVNTGRSLEHLIEGFEQSGFPFQPDWVVAREREIYFLDEIGGWQAHELWNERCLRQIDDLFKEQQPFLSRIRKEIEESTGAQWLEMEGEPAGLISRTEEEMEWIVNRVIDLADPNCGLAWQRNTIYLRFGHRDFHKGTCLSEIAQHFDVPGERCFAMGDSHNDVEMLDPQHAGMIACPANALALVRGHVAAHGGFLASRTHGEGVVEALEHYFAKTRLSHSSTTGVAG